jgi:hypothetical protein
MGDREKFFFQFAFEPPADPDFVASEEEALTWGSFQLWADGRNLCRHRASEVTRFIVPGLGISNTDKIHRGGFPAPRSIRRQDRLRPRLERGVAFAHPWAGGRFGRYRQHPDVQLLDNPNVHPAFARTLVAENAFFGCPDFSHFDPTGVSVQLARTDSRSLPTHCLSRLYDSGSDLLRFLAAST